MSRNKITVPIQLGLKGEFRALVHNGDGVPIVETPYGGNLVTAGGLNDAFQGGSSGYCVAGDGNAPPALSDVLLDNYLGKITSFLSAVGSVQNDPLAGPLWMQSEVRWQFIPGAFGGIPVNIAEAGMTYPGGNILSVNATTALFSRGLLVDSMGAPTTVAVQPTEFLDLFWRFTVNVPDNVAGTVSIDINGTPTNFDYLVNPVSFTPIASASVLPWGFIYDIGGTVQDKAAITPNGLFEISGSTLTRSGASDLPLQTPSTAIGSSPTSLRPQAATASTYVDGDFFRDVELTWTLSLGNLPGGIKSIFVYLGFTQWQVEFTPEIPKTDLEQLDLTFRLSAANTP